MIRISNSFILFFIIGFSVAIEIFSKISSEVLFFRGKIGLVVLIVLAAIALLKKSRSTGSVRIILLLALLSCLPGFGTVADGYGGWQLLLDLKFPLAIYICGAFYSRHFIVVQMPRILMAISLIGTVLVITEIGAPAIYASIFPMSVMSTYVFGTEFVRSTGIFTEASSFGVFCGFAVLYFYALGRYCGWNKVAIYGIALSVFSLIMSGQRFETGAAVMGIVTCMLVERFRRFWLAGIFISLVIVGGLMHVDYSREIIDLFSDSYHVAEDWETFDPRIALLYGGGRLANDNFPMGNGLGTYGSSMSLVSPADGYHDAGIDQLWWYMGDDTPYLTDSYWSMIIGELGWVGFAFSTAIYAYLMLIIGRDFFKCNDGPECFLSRLAFMSSSYGLINSVESVLYVGSMAHIYMLSIMCITALKNTKKT